MNRSGHKHDQPIKKDSKPIDLTRSIRRQQQSKPQNTKSTSKPKHLKHQKKQSHHKLKSPNQKHQDYFKLSANQQFPSKQSSSIKANLSNDYCVNEYFVKSTKIKNLQKKQPKSFYQQQEYFNNNNDFRSGSSNSEIQLYSQQYGFDVYPQQKTKENTSQSTKPINNKISNMMKKISFSDKRALINCDGKIVSSSKQKTKKSQLNKSNSQNTLSFSKQYMSKNDGKKQSKSKSKIKSRSKQTKLKQKQPKQKQSLRQHKITNNDKLTKAKSGQKNTKKQYILIKQNYQTRQPDKIYQTKYAGQQKHSYTESTETLTSKQTNHQPFYYYQRYPTSTTTLVDHSSTESCSSSSTSNLNTKPQTHFPLDLAQIAAEILTEINTNSMTLRKEKQLKFKGNFYLERLKCLNLIANVCGQLRTKRETYFLAVCYFDKYILNIQCKNMKGIALTCIMIALKMDIPQLLPKYCLSFRPNPQATIKKTGKSHKKKKSELSSGSSSYIRQKDSFLDTKDKLSLLITLPIYATQQMYAHEKQQDFHIGEIIQMEIEIASRLKFRFYYKTYAYWIDLLTTGWDQYMLGLSTKNKSSQDVISDQHKVYFKRTAQSATIKHHKDYKLFSYLNQTAQSAFTHIQSYKYNAITITLSTMYLLIRLQLQQKKSLQPLSIYKFYRDNLSKSCNLIFCDTLGVNELFGNFLSKLNLNMAVIVQAVQFVARLIIPEEFKIWNYRELFGENYADRLSNYQYNSNIFRVKTQQ